MKHTWDWRIVGLLSVAVLVSAGLMLPAVLTQVSTPQSAIFGSGTDVDVAAAAGVFLIATIAPGLAAIVVGHTLERRVGLGTPLLRAWLEGDRQRARELVARLPRVFVLGIALATAILLTGLAFRWLLPTLPPDLAIPPIWQGLLMMIGAAVREEILFRYGAVNLLAWLLQLALGRRVSHSAPIWTAIVITSVAFAAAHVAVLPSAFGVTAPAKALAVGIGTAVAIVLGWVYWRYGLTAAIVCHLAAGTTLFAGVQFALALVGR